MRDEYAEEALDLFTEAQAIIHGHFVYTSGRHGEVYVNKDALYKHPTKLARVAEMMADRSCQADLSVVLSPAVGGVALGQWVAFHLGRRLNREVLAVYADKKETGGSLVWRIFGRKIWSVGKEPEKTFFLKRGYDKDIFATSVLIVEDILETGDTARKLVELVRQHRGIPVGVTALWNRRSIPANIFGGIPLRSLLNTHFDSWREEDCPLCGQRRPVNVDYGHGLEFMHRKNHKSIL